MDIFAIENFTTGVSEAGVNFLQPSDSYQNLVNGYIYRQKLQSRQGIGYFAPRLANKTRILGIFEFIMPNDLGTKLLVFDTDNLYTYDTGTKTFVTVAFGGSMAGYAGFNISNKAAYLTGCAYPAKNNSARFVFTSVGMSANANNSKIFFYDGTVIKDYTNLVDNPDYAPPLNPSTSIAGSLDGAKYIFFFNQRLNFGVPVISGSTYDQGYLFSGIQDSSGNGDKYTVAGSGFNQLDTSNVITGMLQVGQTIAVDATRSTWTLERTTDAFNPYFQRQVPGVLGSNADYSAVAWDDSVKSVGKVGILDKNGRQTLRCDNKIPYFTQNRISATLFNLTYGGYDRQNNQFLWTYKESALDGDTQDAVLVYNYEESTWCVYKLRLTVFGQTFEGNNLTWDDIDETTGNLSWEQWDTTTDIWNEIGLGEATEKILAGDDLGFVYELNQGLTDIYANISAVSLASQAVLTVSESSFKVGDLVVVQGVEGTTGINNFVPATDSQVVEPYVVQAATDTTVTINYDSQFDTITPNTGSVLKVIDFRAETIPFNPYRDQGRRCIISHIEILIDNNGGSALIDIFEDEETNPYVQNVLCKPNVNSPKRREWITVSVNNEANFHTIVIKQNSPNVQLIITSIRIHCQAGGYTSG